MPTSNQQLAQWIRKSVALGVKEIHGCFITMNSAEIISACALGMALIGKVGNTKEALQKVKDAPNRGSGDLVIIATFLEIPESFAGEISNRHARGLGNAREIADALENGDLVQQ
jgi:hypothetical protein